MLMTGRTFKVDHLLNLYPGKPEPHYITIGPGDRATFQFENILDVKSWANAFNQYPSRREYETYISYSFTIKYAQGDGTIEIEFYAHKER